MAGSVAFECLASARLALSPDETCPSVSLRTCCSASFVKDLQSNGQRRKENDVFTLGVQVEMSEREDGHEFWWIVASGLHNAAFRSGRSQEAGSMVSSGVGGDTWS